MRIYVVGRHRWEGPAVAKFFEKMGHEVLGDEVLKYPDLLEADLVCFTGGADVSPHLYGEENIASHCDSLRDLFEQQVYDGLPIKLPKVGICRGGQFLNVMNGGKMMQHIEGHHGDHDIVEYGFDAVRHFTIREDHHQGMVAAENGDIQFWDNRDDNQEVIMYHKTNSLCFQPHPEWNHGGTKKLFENLVYKNLGLNLKAA